MPELPEVQTQVDDLQVLVGKKFLDVRTDSEKIFKMPYKIFVQEIRGLKIKSIKRRAKFLLFFLSKKKILIVHFRMTGHFLIDAEDPYIRATFEFSDGTILHYSDIRKFGCVCLSEVDTYEKKYGFDKLGVEPLEDEFTFDKFKEIIKGHKGTVKPFLLSQKFIAGIGNIYADESAFIAGIHPLAKLDKLPLKKQEALYNAIRESLTRGVENRGTTIGEYVDTKGERGKNQYSLFAYKRKGLPCLKCGTEMQRIVVVQRGTTFCDKCQKMY